MRTRSLKLLAALAVVIGIANVSSTASAKIKISASATNLNENVRIIGIQPRIAIGALNSINTIGVIKSSVEITDAIQTQDLNRIPIAAISRTSIGFGLTIRPQIAGNIASNEIGTLIPIIS